MIKKITLTALLAVLFLTNSFGQVQNYFGTSGTLSGSVWSTAVGGPYTSAFSTNASGGVANFGNAGVFTGATITFAGINATANVTGSAGGTISNFGNGIIPINVSGGATLDFNTQAFTTAAGAGYIKNGNGELAMAGATYGGGFTLNSGIICIRGVNAMGGSATNSLAINGGTISTNANNSRDLTGKFTNGITIGGNFTVGHVGGLSTGGGNITFSNATALGGVNRTITLGGSGSVAFGGVISNTGSNGITFAANTNGTGRFDVTNIANTFSGPINITGGEVRFTADGSFGNVNNSVIVDGGRLATSNAAIFTLSASHSLQVGQTASTSISCPGTGILTYNGIIADKPSSIGAWAKQGGGTLVLGGSNTFSGATDINNGIIQITGNDRLPATTTLNLGQVASANTGTFNLNGFSQQVVGLSSNSSTVAFINKNTVTSSTTASLIINSTNNYTYGLGSTANSGIITGAVSLIKSGTGIQTLGDINTYTGVTQINAGELRFCPSASESLSSSAVTLNGGTLGTSGITAASVLSFSTLNVANNSTISLSSASAHTVNFASSNALGWTPSTTLVINGWQGTYNSAQGSGGTFGKIFVGSNSSALTSAQLSQIRFFDGTNYYYATLLNTGELVPFQGTKLQLAFCAYTSTSTTEFIWADSIGTPSINTANRYRFLLINGANSFTWTTNNEWPIMQFYLISGIANGTTYTTSVAWSSDGGTTWSPYGPECNLTSPSSSTTQLTGSSCGSSPASFNTIIYANVVPNATQYQYQLINSSLSYTQSIVKSNNNFILSQFTGLTNNTTYSVTVRVNMGSGFGSYGTSCNVTTPGAPTTQLTAGSCGSSPASYNTLLFADAIGGATQYQYKLMNTSLSYTQSYIKSNNNFILSQFTNLQNNTTYSVTVCVYFNSAWQPYGSSCNVSTPGSPTTQLTAGSCGSSPASYNTLLFADAIGGATQYEYRLINSSLSYTQSFVKTNNNFNLAQFSGLANGTTYSVSVRVNLGTGFGNYGSACNITTPSTSPTTDLQPSYCSYTAPTFSTIIFATAVSGATQYEYRLINSSLSYTQSFVKTNGNFNLSLFTGLVLSTTYTVQVRVFFNSAWGPYGSICNVTTPASASPLPVNVIPYLRLANTVENESIETVFDAMVYPNPYTQHFAVNLSRYKVNESVSIRVFDATGKLIEQHSLTPNEVSNLNLGAQYSAGIYNVVVSQAGKAKSIKVVKP